MDYFQKYFKYIGPTEAPRTYHRWSAIAAVGALLGRQFHFPFGHMKIYPNMYVMLMGSPGTRKSTAVNAAKKAMVLTGYDQFAADRMSKEMFLKAMMQTSIPNMEDCTIDDIMDIIPENGHEMHIVADEFTDFIGQGNTEFLTMLGKIWDCPPEYKHPKLTGPDVIVDKPTVNLLSGNTPAGFSLAFPPEAIGQGFTSRLVFVHADPTGKKIAWPEPPCGASQEALRVHLIEMCESIKGVANLTDDARIVAKSMYDSFEPIDDHRFANYTTRRHTHLLKLSLCMAAADLSSTVTKRHMLEANTMLHYTECSMSKALGEYGKGKHSSVQQDILAILNKAVRPISMSELWRHVASDLTRQSELVDIIKGLLSAHKIQPSNLQGQEVGFMPNHLVREEWGQGLILHDYLSLEEMA